MEIKEYEVYEFIGDDIPKWCFHNILIVKRNPSGIICFEDTYWGTKIFTIDDIQKKGWRLKKICDDIREMKKISKREFEFYRDEDKLYIPIGGGSEQFFVKKSAKKDPKKVKKILKYTIQSLQVKINNYKMDLEKCKKMLCKVDEIIENGNFYIPEV